MLDERRGPGDYAVEGAFPADFQPMRRAGREQDMAGSTLYFASEAGVYCHGSTHVIECGRLGVVKGSTCRMVMVDR